MNAGVVLMALAISWWLCQIAAAYGPGLNGHGAWPAVFTPTAAQIAGKPWVYPAIHRPSCVFPPFANRLVLRFTPTLERVGSVWWPAMGGVLLVEAEKMLYAPSGIRRAPPRRLRARPVLAGQTSGHISSNG